MDNNFTVTAAFVTAFAAIVAPTITALIHSIKEYKISKMNSTIVKRLELCEIFTDAYSSCQYGTEKCGFALAFYKKSLKLATVCHRRSVQRSLFLLANEVLQNGASKDTDKLYEHCIQLLSKEF